MGIELVVCKLPSDADALLNVVFLNPGNVPPQSHLKYICIMNKYYFTIKRDSSIPMGCMGMSSPFRLWTQVSLNQMVNGNVVDIESVFGTECFVDKMELEVQFLKKSYANALAYDIDEMCACILKNFSYLVVSKGQPLVFDFQGVNIQGTVSSIECNGLKAISGLEQGVCSSKKCNTGIMLPQSSVSIFKEESSFIKLSGSSSSSSRTNRALLRSDFKFEDLGIGGLDEEFTTFFRRAFASRIYPPHFIEKLGILHVKGILLFGPPGTGKTLIARQIGQMLRAHPPKVVNGPEILNKYVGQSEENIRNLFKDAETEFKAKGDDSQLHIIIFDELDAICRQRGSKNDSTGVGDSVVNQLLSKVIFC